MTKASYVSLTLARFETLTTAGRIDTLGIDGVIFAGVGTDTRAAGTKYSSGRAYTFVIPGLHTSEKSAHELVDRRAESLPWIEGACDVWSGVLRPIRHVGECNFLDRNEPGLIYDCGSDATPDGPFLVLTTAGFDESEDLRDRILEFSNGVNAVRTSMTAVPGLRSQQSFFIDNDLVIDGMTVTFWEDFASMRDYAYGAGVHRDYVVRQKQERLANRTSFSRMAIERSVGTWRGYAPISN